MTVPRVPEGLEPVASVLQQPWSWPHGWSRDRHPPTPQPARVDLPGGRAVRGLVAFGTRLREQVDLDTLSVELLVVVNHAMEPTNVSLWLRPPHPAPRVQPQ
jgi:hypothetical protein